MDKGPRSVTLARLLTEISQRPEVLSRQRYVAMFDWGMQHLGDKQFDEGVSPSGGQVVMKLGGHLFGASPCRAAPEGPILHLWYSTAR